VLKRRKTSFSLDAQRKPGLMSGHSPPPILIPSLQGKHNETKWMLNVEKLFEDWENVLGIDYTIGMVCPPTLIGGEN
jgi:hypothetical protein